MYNNRVPEYILHAEGLWRGRCQLASSLLRLFHPAAFSRLPFPSYSAFLLFLLFSLPLFLLVSPPLKAVKTGKKSNVPSHKGEFKSWEIPSTVSVLRFS